MTAIGTNATHRIIVIDDNPSIHEDFRKILAKPRPFISTLDDFCNGYSNMGRLKNIAL